MAFVPEDGNGFAGHAGSAASVASGGGGYIVGDTITLAGGTVHTVATVLRVSAIAAGAVTAVTIQTAGVYSVAPTNPVAQASSSGAGTLATFTMTFEAVVANAYVTAAYFTAHHTDRNVQQVVDGDYSQAEVEAAIVRASDYIDKRFGRRFRGFKAKKTQGLEWPRFDAQSDEDYPLDGIPDPLAKATAEYALISLLLARELAPVPNPGFSVLNPATGTVTDGGGALESIRKKVGPIETEKTYASGGSSGRPMTSTGNATQNIPEYPQADLWIEELTESTMSRELHRG